MTDTDKQSTIFISYAWGEKFEKKEWVRQHIVAHLQYTHEIFWDRDSIAIGESMEQKIAQALNKRPLLVLCLCDWDYLDAAQRNGSGLYRELQFLKRIADEPQVRIVPLILDDCADRLPEPLEGRVYLNLEPLQRNGLDLSTTLIGVVNGLSQAQIKTSINAQMKKADLVRRTRIYLEHQPIVLWGNAITHEVTVCRPDQSSYPLLAPQWMWESEMWNYMLGDETSTFCPTEGRWHWDYFSPSRGMQALGTAVLSTFFPNLVGEDIQYDLSRGGAVLAINFFSTVYITEPFRFDKDDIITFLINHPEGYAVLEKLIGETYSETTNA